MTGPDRVAVVINPIAGIGVSVRRARRRAERASDLLSAARVASDIVITERAGHAAELARGAVARGARVVVAWGGDGTVNEVAAALVGSAASLAVIPAGSGNGLARTIGMPAGAAPAFDRILHGADRVIDVGEIDGRVFVNVAGIGFDARVAQAFASIGRRRRGLLRYGAIVARELRRYESGCYDLTLDPHPDAVPMPLTAFLLTFANGRQWGNGAIIAPAAELDDGLLDVVAVEDRGWLAALRAIPRLFTGTLPGAAGVSVYRIRTARVTGRQPLLFHADGEPHVGTSSLVVAIRPQALRLRC